MNLQYGHYQELVDGKRNSLLKKAHTILDAKQYEVVKLAVDVASHAHFKQMRKSGEPYITHPFEVATIICEWGLDAQTIAASILHDVVEDTEITQAEVEQIFGSNIANLVDSVTKLEKLNFETEELAQAEYFRKVVLAMAKDIRVILIKLADRLHNILTLESQSKYKIRKIALETLEIYAPIANKIGLHKVFLTLADESFKHLFPFRYKILAKAVKSAQQKRLPIIEHILKDISNSMRSNGINANFIYRQRSIYNLYQRMLRRKQSFNRIYDIFEIKIIVDNIRNCYLTLGVLHSLYQPLPGKFKDYIAIPKGNGYQSLHSTLMGPHGIPIQLHIRTVAMEDVAENGIITHYIKNPYNDEFLPANQRTNNWIKNILDIQASSFSAYEFLDTLKQDLSPTDIYVFTPKGKIIILPKGATGLDFAYYISNNIGNKCHQIKINQKLEKINTKLQNGDIVEVIINDNIEPTLDWLNIVITGKAMSRIRQYLKEQKSDENIENGYKFLTIALELLDSTNKMTINTETVQKIQQEFFPKLRLNELLQQIGNGQISALDVIKKVLRYEKNKIMQIKLKNCKIPIIQDKKCYPLPGDNIFASINRYGELLLHAQNCKNLKQTDLENFSLINIINDNDSVFLCKIYILLFNSPGIFTKLSSIIAKKGINIEEIVQEVYTWQHAKVILTLKVKDRKQMDNLISMLQKKNYTDQINYLT